MDSLFVWTVTIVAHKLGYNRPNHTETQRDAPLVVDEMRVMQICVSEQKIRSFTVI